MTRIILLLKTFNGNVVRGGSIMSLQEGYVGIVSKDFPWMALAFVLHTVSFLLLSLPPVGHLPSQMCARKKRREMLLLFDNFEYLPRE